LCSRPSRRFLTLQEKGAGLFIAGESAFDAFAGFGREGRRAGRIEVFKTLRVSTDGFSEEKQLATVPVA
jgi:hypothetical protein